MRKPSLVSATQHKCKGWRVETGGGGGGGNKGCVTIAGVGLERPAWQSESALRGAPATVSQSICCSSPLPATDGDARQEGVTATPPALKDNSVRSCQNTEKLARFTDFTQKKTKQLKLKPHLYYQSALLRPSKKFQKIITAVNVFL